MALKTYQRYLVALIPIVILGLITYYFSEIVTYIILAWILSMIGAPLHKRLQPVLGSTGAAIATLASFSLICIILISVFIPPIIQQARKFANIDYEKVFDGLEEPIKDWNDWLVDRGLLEPEIAGDLADSTTTIASLPAPIRIDTILRQSDGAGDNISIYIQVNDQQEEDVTAPTPSKDTFIDRAKHSIMDLIQPDQISQLLTKLFGALGNVFITLASVFFIAFFFLKESNLFDSAVRAIAPNNEEDKWTEAIQQSADLLKRYFIGIVIQISLITLFVSTVLSLLGFENALLIGFFAGLANVIPYVGPFIGVSFGAIITIASKLSVESQAINVDFYGDLLPSLGILAGVFFVMQMLDNFILQPNIFSRSVKAHPLEIFIVILAGAKIGGVLGMVIAIPAYTVLRVIAKMFLSEFKIVQRITSGI